MKRALLCLFLLSFSYVVQAQTFTLFKENGDAHLVWKTINEQNVSHFEMERSLDGAAYVKVGRINAAGTSSTAKAYAFIDHDLRAQKSSVVYYRLKLKDNDEKFTYSKPVRVRLDLNRNHLSLYPNPVSEYAVLEISSDKSDQINYSIINVSGRIVPAKSILVNRDSNSINLPVGDLASGAYFIIVRKEQSEEHIKFIKQ